MRKIPFLRHLLKLDTPGGLSDIFGSPTALLSNFMSAMSDIPQARCGPLPGGGGTPLPPPPRSPTRFPRPPPPRRPERECAKDF